jgi:hypothetical protein
MKLISTLFPNILGRWVDRPHRFSESFWPSFSGMPAGNWSDSLMYGTAASMALDFRIEMIIF